MSRDIILTPVQGGLAARARSLLGTSGEFRHLRRQERAGKRSAPAGEGEKAGVQANAAAENGTINAAGLNSTAPQIENQAQVPPQVENQGQVIPPQFAGGQVWVVNGQAVQLVNGQLVAVNQNQLQMVQVVPIGVISQTTAITQCRVVTVQQVQQANAVIVNGQVVPVQAVGGQFQQFQAVGRQGQAFPVQVGNVQGVPAQQFGEAQVVPSQRQSQGQAENVQESQGAREGAEAAAEAERL